MLPEEVSLQPTAKDRQRLCGPDVRGEFVPPPWCQDRKESRSSRSAAGAPERWGNQSPRGGRAKWSSRSVGLDHGLEVGGS